MCSSSSAACLARALSSRLSPSTRFVAPSTSSSPSPEGSWSLWTGVLSSPSLCLCFLRARYSHRVDCVFCSAPWNCMAGQQSVRFSSRPTSRTTCSRSTSRWKATSCSLATSCAPSLCCYTRAWRHNSKKCAFGQKLSIRTCTVLYCTYVLRVYKFMYRYLLYYTLTPSTVCLNIEYMDNSLKMSTVSYSYTA